MSEFNFKSAVCTSREQSERLLALGLKKETADCYEYEVKEAEGKVVAEGSAFPTYEEALSTAVRMAVEHLKEKQDGM